MVLNRLGGMEEKVVEKMMSKMTPSETPLFRALVDVVTTHELQQAQAIQRGLEAADTDVELRYSPQDRSQQLLDVADAVTDRRFKEWWFQELVEKPDVAENYVGLDGDEWHEQLRSWYITYYDAGLVEEPVDQASPGRIGEVADRHIRETFGISLQEFVGLVVNWDRSRVMDQVLSSQTRYHTQLIHRLAEEIEQREERIEELEYQLREAKEK